MNIVGALFRRELNSYFATPVAYVFIVIFLVLMGTFTFYIGGFYERGQADLRPFFNFHPWQYILPSYRRSLCAYGPRSEKPEPSSC